MKKGNQKRTILTVAVLVCLILISAAFALFYSNFSVTNEFVVTGAKAEFREIFHPPAPGDNPFEDGTEETDVPTPDNPGGTGSLASSYVKKGIVINDGDVDVRVRASITAKWVEKAAPNKELPDLNILPGNKSAAWLSFDGKTYIDASEDIGFPYVNTALSADDAVWKYAAADQNFYYTKDAGIIPGKSGVDEADALLGKVVFNKELLGTVKTAGSYYVKAEYEADPKAATAYDTQEEAKEAADIYMKGHPGTDAVILYQETSIYALLGFDKAKLEVTIAGDIAAADSVTVNADGTWTFK